MGNARYILRLIAAFLLRFRFIIIFGVLLGLVSFFLINLILKIAGNADRKSIGIVGRYTTEKIPLEILSQMGEGLTKIDESGDVAPNLALSWESPDRGKTWIFKLRSDIYWQDGIKLTSHDIKYNFSDLTYETPDESTIVFKLVDPYSAFPSVVSRPIFKKGLLGTASWQVKKIELAGNYIQELKIQEKSGKTIIYKFYPTEERAKLGFKLGEIDTLKDVMNPEPFNKWGKVKIEEKIDKSKFVVLFFNTQNSGLSDKTFRQSLGYAIDKSALGGVRALSPISENSWAYNPQVKAYNYDLPKAKEGIKEGTELTLTTSPILLPVAEKIIKNWQEAGLNAKVQALAAIPQDYEALLAIFDIPEDPDQYSIWHTTQTATNITRFSNPRIDKLLEDGRTEINLEERKKIYLDFQRYLVEDSPAIFLYYPTTYSIKRH